MCVCAFVCLGWDHLSSFLYTYTLQLCAMYMSVDSAMLLVRFISLSLYTMLYCALYT